MVTARSSSEVSAEARQPPSGSIGLRQGGEIWIDSREVPGGRMTESVWFPGSSLTQPRSWYWRTSSAVTARHGARVWVVVVIASILSFPWTSR